MADPTVSPEHHTSGRTLILVGVFLAIATMLALPVRTWLTQRSALDDLRSEIGAAQARVGTLQQEQVQWQDPAFIEQQARLRLNMVRPGESGLIVLDPHDQPDTTETVEQLPDTWYGRLWHSAEVAAGEPAAPDTPDAP